MATIARVFLVSGYFFDAFGLLTQFSTRHESTTTRTGSSVFSAFYILLVIVIEFGASALILSRKYVDQSAIALAVLILLKVNHL